MLSFRMFLKDNIKWKQKTKQKMVEIAMHVALLMWWAVQAVRCRLHPYDDGCLQHRSVPYPVPFIFFFKSLQYGYGSCHTDAVEPSIWWRCTALDSKSAWGWWLTNFCIVPRNELEDWILYYWRLGFPDTKVADHALDYFDHNVYGLRYCVRCVYKSKY